MGIGSASHDLGGEDFISFWTCSSDISWNLLKGVRVKAGSMVDLACHLDAMIQQRFSSLLRGFCFARNH